MTRAGQGGSAGVLAALLALLPPLVAAARQGTPLPVAPTATLELELSDASGRLRARGGGDLRIDAQERVELRLVPLDRPAAPATELVGRLYERSRHEGLAPGRYRLEARARRLATEVRELELRAGATTACALELARLEHGLVAGRLVARSGAVELELASVVLVGVEPPRRSFLAQHGGMCGVGVDADLVEQGGELRFALAAPVEDYVAHVIALDAAVWPPRAPVRPGDPPLVFTVLDVPDERGFRLEAFDARSGAPLAGVRLASPTEDPRFPLPDRAGPGRLLAPAELAGRAFELVVHAPAHVPLHADQTAFAPSADGWRARFELEPGWGRCLVARDLEGAPVAGLEVRVEGRLVASTDARGHADVVAREEPRALGLFHRDLRVVDGDVDPRDGRVRRHGAWRMQVRLAPR